jgi:hypothetical protein
MRARTFPGLSTHVPVFYKSRKLNMHQNHFQGTDFLALDGSHVLWEQRNENNDIVNPVTVFLGAHTSPSVVPDFCLSNSCLLYKHLNDSSYNSRSVATRLLAFYKLRKLNIKTTIFKVPIFSFSIVRPGFCQSVPESVYQACQKQIWPAMCRVMPGWLLPRVCVIQIKSWGL